MATIKIDYKKEYKDLYLPKQQPVLIHVPEISFFMVDGSGSPQGEEYQRAIQALYALSFTIKMSKMSGNQPEDYFEYVVPPLEGFWCIQEGSFDSKHKDKWTWTSVIRQPEFVTPQMFDWALEECRKKKPDIDISKVRFETFTEGLCVQVMHIGPYVDESPSLAKITTYIKQNGLIEDINEARRHHEIYLGDPRKSPPEKWRTVLRIPVKKNNL